MLLSPLLWTMLLAVSVVSIPSTQAMTNDNILSKEDIAVFDAAKRATTDARKSMQQLCQKGDKQAIQGHFQALQPPLKQLSFHIQAMFQSAKTIALKRKAYMKEFVGIVIDLNEIVKVVKGYPDIVVSVKVQVKQLDVFLLHISDSLTEADVDINKGFVGTQVNFQMMLDFGFGFAELYLPKPKNTPRKPPSA
ncbi:hypothetical protein O181_049969 [Austropuccinia psidii MF-1]|uniref:Uncharacterized protein n=1 Tax=Austropuccinia psidii MF-1 TaxID=1389203 RepID=A0A9Q3DVY9_9BASI|nr:hypothetical protein [Austropuccinia psidii MF-1]